MRADFSRYYYPEVKSCDIISYTSSGAVDTPAEERRKKRSGMRFLIWRQLKDQ